MRRRRGWRGGRSDGLCSKDMDVSYVNRAPCIIPVNITFGFGMPKIVKFERNGKDMLVQI